MEETREIPNCRAENRKLYKSMHGYLRHVIWQIIETS